jgi:hypothetical protein
VRAVAHGGGALAGLHCGALATSPRRLSNPPPLPPSPPPPSRTLGLAQGQVYSPGELGDDAGAVDDGPSTAAGRSGGGAGGSSAGGGGVNGATSPRGPQQQRKEQQQRRRGETISGKALAGDW